MAIKKYQVNGKVKFEVYVNLRSKTDPTIRFQKRVRGIETLRAAKSEEKKQTRLVLERIHQKEGVGVSWKRLLERWELFQWDPATSQYNPSVVKDYLSMIRKWTKGWYLIPVSRISRADVKDLFRSMDKAGRSLNYQKKMKRVISQLLTWAVEERIVTEHFVSPFRDHKFPKVEEKMPEILSLKGIQDFLLKAKQVDHPWYPVWAVALLTGLRSGELFALTWDRVDFENNVLRIQDNYSCSERRIGPTKGRYWRVVPISKELKRLLVEIYQRSNGGYKCEYLDGNFVLPRFKPWRTGHQASELKTFCKGFGLPEIKFHTLRACFATHLLNQNVTAAKVMKICGWKELKTMERYIRLAGIEVRGVTDTLNFIAPDAPPEREFDNVVMLRV